MKKLRLLFAVFLICLLGNRLKAQTYSFSNFTSTYTELTGATVISMPYWDDFSVFGVALPFSFTYFGTSFDSVYVMGGFEGFIYDGNGTFGDYEIASYEYAGLTDNTNGTATISVATTGTAPNRIFKIQTKDAGFYDNSAGTDYTNLQVWFYESSNVIEMHYGPSSVIDPNSWWIPGATGPGVILAQTNINYLALSGPAASPVATNVFVSFTLTGTPPDGMVYRFTPTSTGIEESAGTDDFIIFPNPNSGSFKIRKGDLSAKAELTVFDLTGKPIYYCKLASSGLSDINLPLASGTYMIVLNDGEKRFRKNLVIQ